MADHETQKKPASTETNSLANQSQQIDTPGGYEIVDGGTVQRATLNLRKSRPQEVLQLQRVAGNRAIARLLPSASEPALARRAIIPAPRTQVPRIQAKLMVGPANDHYEREADEVAARVMRMPKSPAPRAAKRLDDTTAEGLGFKIQRASMDHVQLDRIQAAKIQRDHAESDVDSSQGFETDATFQRRLGANKGRGRALPSTARHFMEQRFQTDFTNVRVHTGSDAVQMSRDISAKAFTHGNHIFFNSGHYAPDTNAGKQLLAHELTHVIQQKGSVQRWPTGVIQRSKLTNWFKSKFSKKKKDKTEDPTSQSKTGPSKTDPTEESNQATPDPSRDDAIAYERNLGRYAYNHTKANSAVKTVLDKMTKVLMGDFDASNDEQQKRAAEIYGRDNVQSAGQVGTDVKAVLGVLKEGNLRERMTALMNAMFGPFKQYVQEIFSRSAWSDAKSKDLNVDKLKRRKRQRKWNLGAKDLFRDPGNPLDRKNFSTWQHTGKTREAAKETSNRTVGDLEDGPFGIGLSDREKALQFPGQDPDLLDDSEKLKWQEGGTYWAVNHKNKWVKKVENSLHMPVIAGPSGTMLRMFQTWEYLNKPVSAADWRLAVMGWMLTSNDHSFHEMMLTASDYGLPYIPGHMAYMNVDPISLMELRRFVTVDGLFPHEHALNRQIDTGSVKHMLTSDDVDDGDSVVSKLKKEERGALSGTGAAAIDLYTRFGYLILNPSRKGGMFAGKQIERNLKKKEELEDLKDDFEAGKLTAKQLMKEAESIMPVLDTALETLPDWSGKLFRGTGTFNPFSYRKGSKIRFGAYTSATLDEDTAKGFADDFNIGPFKYILHMNTTAGKDVRELSSYNEDEILIPPGSEFAVTKREKPKSGRRYYQIYLDQTKRGGMGLKLNPDEDIILPGVEEEDESISDSSTDDSVSEDFEPTLSELPLYDSSDMYQGKLNNPSDVKHNDVSSFLDNDVLWIEISTDSGLYWVKGEELEGFTGITPPALAKLKKSKLTTSTSGSGDSSSGSTDTQNDKSEESSVSHSPTITAKTSQSLDLYDDFGGLSDTMTHVQTIDSPSDIIDNDVSSYQDENGVKWTQILGPSSMLYWVKHTELEAFTA